jgi:hypothetical protein
MPVRVDGEIGARLASPKRAATATRIAVTGAAGLTPHGRAE